MTMRIMLAALVVAGLSAASLQAEESKPDQAGVFKRLDANGDGKLRADEVPADKRAFFDRALRSGDADGDGALNAAEFAKAFSAGKDSGRERDSRRRPGSSSGSRSTPSAAGFIKRLDKDGDGKVSSEELPQTYRARLGGKFKEFDKNKDGALNQQEVAAMLTTANSSRRPSGTPSRDSDRPRPSSRDAAQPSQDGLFAILDRDRDGKLSRRELEAAGSILARLDRDKDGSLSKREIAAVASDKAPSSRPSRERSSRERDSRGGISSYAKRLDKDNDGKITREEASGPIKERFDRLDEDGDGILKVEDVEKAFKRSRSRSSKDSKDSDTRESDRRKRSPEARKDSDTRENDRRKRSPRARKDSDSPEGGDKPRRPSRQRDS